MLDKSSARGGLTRRAFLATTVGAASAVSLHGCAAPAKSGQDSLGETGGTSSLPAEFSLGQPDNPGEEIKRGVCRPNCVGYCKLNVHVKDGKIVKTSRGSYPDGRYDRICHRGLSHVQRVYDPDRLQYPLRRVEGTERGAGEWERVTWDEALTEIAEKVLSLREEYGNQAVQFITLSGNLAYNGLMYTQRLANAFGGGMPAGGADMAAQYALHRMAGPATNGWEANEMTDMANSDVIMCWGSNLTDAQVQNWHFIKEAQLDGTPLVVIDPAYTQLASKADLWVPIRPATDTALALGLMNIILEKNAVDVEFMRDHTCAPLLVRADTKRFLRASDVGMGDETQYVVLQGGNPVVLDDSVTPDLEGSAVVGDIACTTSFDLLKEIIAEYTVDAVSKLTDVPEETLYKLADYLIGNKVFHYCGFGSQAWVNGTHTVHSGLTLCALTGNLGKPGASYGFLFMSYTGINGAVLAPNPEASAPASIPLWNMIDIVDSGTFNGDPYLIKMIYVWGTNFINCAPDTNGWLQKVWPKLDFIVVADIEMTDTAMYADLVLPVCSWFEYEDVTAMGASFYITHNEKCIEPLYESKSDSQIARELGEKLGVGEYVQLSDSEFLEQILDSPIGEELGISYEQVKRDGQARTIAKDTHVAFEGGVFSTPSGRLEFYIEDPTPRMETTLQITPELIDRERLPRWFAPGEGWHENPKFEKYPIILNSIRPRWRVHSQWYNVKALRELDPEPTVRINPKDAADRGVQNGDYVEVFNDRGHAVAKAVLSEGIRPGVIVYPKGWEIWQHKAGCWSELNNPEIDPFSVNPNFMDNLCDFRIWNEEGEE